MDKKMDDMKDFDLGFDMDDEDMYEEVDTIIGQKIHLMLDDESEMDSIVIAELEVEGYPDWTYVALLPLLEDVDEEETDVLLYRLVVDQDGNPNLGSIESDEEYDAVAEAFYEEMQRLEEEAEAIEEE